MPKTCNGCYKQEVRPFEGLHPFLLNYPVCSVYPYTGWVERIGGCSFNATPTVAPDAKRVNPLKASKRKAR